ncbi:uncharacterized protein ELE39_003568 [Cryptosporidium sp. chipmunk genotype I]|uniref:uncharacterized protein n=1 Tax=Cryptosporidium sp. chipmunk genotype I TaxID=1280935 RepID=UPI00351A5519|nr:hypothetical protein ELE39_003568 [Cryptosporidium sp. chipmunk genotype I]
MTNAPKKPTSGGEIKPSVPIPMFDEESNNKEFFVVTLEEGNEEHRIPFLVNFVNICEPKKFKRLIALELKSYKFYVITVNNQNSELRINNEYGKLKFTFDTHVYSVNADKVLKENSGYQKDLNQVVLKNYDYENIPERPKYYNSKYKTLIPANFNVFRDQQYTNAGQEGVEFKGIFSLIDTKIKMPTVKTGDTYEFFSIARCYATFQGREVDQVYAVPVPRDMKCYVNENDCTIRMVDSTNDVTYKVDSGELSIEEFKAFTNNVFRFKVILAKTVEEAMVTGLSRLSGLGPDER